MSKIANSDNPNIKPEEWKCPICEILGISTTLKSATHYGLSVSREAHLRNKHEIHLNQIPPEKKHDSKHLVELYKAIQFMKKKRKRVK